MSEKYPFQSFCQDVFVPSKSSIERSAVRIGCTIADLAYWCSGTATPKEADLIRIHFAVMDARDFTTDVRERWESILRMPVTIAIRLPRLLQIEGEPDPNNASLTVAQVIESALLDQLITIASDIRISHRLKLLQRFVEHATTISHYHPIR